MKIYKDSKTGDVIYLEDDVVASGASGARVFTAAHGDVLNLPATLEPFTPPVPTAAQLAAAAVAQFAANKAAALAAIDQFHAHTVQGLAGNPTQVEKDSWAMKLATANAVVAKAVISAEGAAFMAAAGMDTAALKTAWAAAVQANAAKFAGLVGLADKLRSAAKAAVTAALDQAALDAAIAANKTTANAVLAALPQV
ncbi:MAG: hypothetical protein ABL856_00725 [Gallionella sp.]